jgi:hypothetical protein
VIHRLASLGRPPRLVAAMIALESIVDARTSDPVIGLGPVNPEPQPER